MNKISRLVVLPTIALFLLTIVWSVASPLGSSADDDYHLTSIFCKNQHVSVCELSANGEVASIPRFVLGSPPCYRVPDPARQGAFCINAVDLSKLETPRFNSKEIRPSLFYNVLSVFASERIGLSIMGFRIFNGLLATLLFCLALISTPNHIRRTLMIVWGIAMIPVGIFYVVSANPSSWAISGVGTFWAFISTVIYQRRNGLSVSKVAILGCILSAVIAMGARNESGIFVIVATVAAFIAIKPSSTSQPIKIKYKIMLLLVPLILMLSTAKLVWVRFGDDLREIGNLEQFPGGPNPVLNAVIEIPAFVFSHFGGQGAVWNQGSYSYASGIGWLEFRLPSLTGFAIGAAAVALAFAGLNTCTRRKLISVAFVTLAFVSFSVLSLAAFNFRSGVALQPRYTFPFLLVVLAFYLLPKDAEEFSISRAQIYIASISLTVGCFLTWLRVATYYSNGDTASYLNIGLPPNWWWQVGPSKLTWSYMALFATLFWIYSSIIMTISKSNAKLTLKTEAFVGK